MATFNSVSYYKSIGDVNSDLSIPLDIFLDNIKTGKWEDLVHAVRVIENKKERDKLKTKSLPSITLSGKFFQRYDNKIEKHSGFIGIDIDEDGFPNGMTADEFKQLICSDQYCVAAFLSASGRGLCVVFRINPAKHREAFQGLCEHIHSTYNAICDPTSINESRARFVSFDPGIYINHAPTDKFTKYPKQKPIKKIDRTIFAKNDFENIIQQICGRHIDLTESSYYKYLRIAFALVHQFGEAGRQYFHLLAQFSPKYDSATADKQYNNCLRHTATNVTTISTLYYYAKEAGVEIYTVQTRKIAYSASHGRKAGLKTEQIAKNLSDHEDIPDTPEVRAIIDQVINDKIELNDDSLIDQLEMFIRQNYDLKLNTITRFIENNEVPMKKRDLNSIYIKAKKIIDGVSFDLVDRLIDSDFIPEYNPVKDFINAHIEQGTDPETPNIKKLFSCIETNDPDFAYKYGKKWFVSMISGIYTTDLSPLWLVLTGKKQHTGKTEFFKRLLPDELKRFLAKSDLNRDKDDMLLMTQKLLIFVDDMKAKSRREDHEMKKILSSDIYSLREPYGRHNIDIIRLAILGATTNENELLTDVENRRNILIHVENIDHKLYNSIDKTELFMEAYHAWKNKFDWKVTREEMDDLNKFEGSFRASVAEADLILQYFEPINPDQFNDVGVERMTATGMKVEIERNTGQRLSLTIIGRELQRLHFNQKHIKVAGTTQRFYMVKRVSQVPKNGPGDEDDDLPF